MKTLKLNYFVLLFVISFFTTTTSSFAKDYELFSPDKKTKIVITVEKNVSYSVFHNSDEILSKSPLSLTLKTHGVLGANPKVKKTEIISVNERIYPVVKEKRKVIIDNFNQITLDFKGNYGVVFRAYDNAVAYRFKTKFKGDIIVKNEEVTFNFNKNHSVFYPTEKYFFSHSERLYEYIKLSEITDEKMSCIPVVVDVENGPKLAIAEADIDDYAGLYMIGSKNSETALTGKFPQVALEEKQETDRDVDVSKRADYIAKTKGTRTFPWRILAIADKDGDLIENDIVYKLAKPLKLQDVTWIKPGKVSWDWWNMTNNSNVDFKSGVNTATYKYHIDFASKYNIEYVILDEGWYFIDGLDDDLLKINPDVDLDELLKYAKEKNVGLILWVTWKALDDQLEEALNQFKEWGVVGIKVDFMQRDDQWMVNYYRKIAREAAKRHLLVDFHGSYKPDGLRREYPNVITREGIRGMEWSKWSEFITPEHCVTIPFTRMFAGPMDFTPGATRNAQKENFKPFFSRPMSQGTRTHQMAMYVIYESPLQMLCDAPSNYLKEPDMMDFLSKVPTVWDETIALDAKIGDYVAVARKSGEEWYVGAMTDWTSRELEIDFSFLEDGDYQIDMYEDGINADTFATDYKRTKKEVSKTDKMKIKLAKGGGWAARVYKK